MVLGPKGRTDADAIPFENAGEILAGELAALVGVWGNELLGRRSRATDPDVDFAPESLLTSTFFTRLFIIIFQSGQ